MNNEWTAEAIINFYCHWNYRDIPARAYVTLKDPSILELIEACKQARHELYGEVKGYDFANNPASIYEWLTVKWEGKDGMPSETRSIELKCRGEFEPVVDADRVGFLPGKSSFTTTEQQGRPLTKTISLKDLYSAFHAARDTHITEPDLFEALAKTMPETALKTREALMRFSGHLSR